MEKTGKDGVKLTVPEEIMAFSGEKHLLVADWGSVCICDQEYTDALTVLMEYTVMDQDAEREIFINDRDMPLFYERVLKKLDMLKLLEVRDLDLESFRAKGAQVLLLFRQSGPGK